MNYTLSEKAKAVEIRTRFTEVSDSLTEQLAISVLFIVMDSEQCT